MQELFGTLSGVFTAIMIVLLGGISLWAWSGKRRDAFDASACVPLEEDAAIRDAGSTRERAP
jgi:cytochrome c oxidase cbb3-type subunit 4